MDHTVPYWTMNKCWKFRGNNSTDHYVKSIQIWSFFWSVFSRIRTEYGEIRIISPYSVWMRENTDQKKLCIWTLFHAVDSWDICDTSARNLPKITFCEKAVLKCQFALRILIFKLCKIKQTLCWKLENFSKNNKLERKTWIIHTLNANTAGKILKIV